MKRLSLPVLLAALSACPVTHTPSSEVDGGTAEIVGRACSVDAECGPLRCDKVRRQCICLSDQSCVSRDPFAPPRYCNNYTGLCVTEIAGCTSASQCQNTDYCDPSTRTCRPLKTFCEPCSGNDECGGRDDNCVLDQGLQKRFCGKACTGDQDCPRGATCQMKDNALQCWPDKTATGQQATCKNFQGCTPDSLRTCNSTSDCGEASQRCDPAKGKCVAIQQSCPFGTTCDPRNKLCVADCVRDQDCGDASLRCNNRVCEPVNDCTIDTDCPSNRVCTIAPGATTGTCHPFCQADVDCPLGQVCTQAGSRYTCKTGCGNNASCPLNQRCNLTTKQCEGPVVAGVRVCQATSACSSCEVCNGVSSECVSAKNQYPFCTSCTTAADCTGGACVALADGASYCMRLCGIGQECPQGFACLTLTTGAQACVPADRSCAGKCP